MQSPLGPKVCPKGSGDPCREEEEDEEESILNNNYADRPTTAILPSPCVRHRNFLKK